MVADVSERSTRGGSAHDRLLRRTYESADCVIGVADYVAEFLVGPAHPAFEIMSETAVHEVHDRPSIVRSADRPVRLLYVGRIVRTKGLRDVIRALADLRDLDVDLDVVGDGNDREACEVLAIDLGCRGDRSPSTASFPADDVDAFYERADVFVFPELSRARRQRQPGGDGVRPARGRLPRGGPGANVDDSCAIRLDSDSPEQLAADCAAAVRTLVDGPRLRSAWAQPAREQRRHPSLWAHRVARAELDLRRDRRGPRPVNSVAGSRKDAATTRLVTNATELGRGSTRPASTSSTHSSRTKSSSTERVESLGVRAPVLDHLLRHHQAPGGWTVAPPHLLQALARGPASQAGRVQGGLPSRGRGVRQPAPVAVRGVAPQLGVELHLQAREESRPRLVLGRQPRAMSRNPGSSIGLITTRLVGHGRVGGAAQRCMRWRT